MDRADPQKYNTANNLNNQIISNEYFPNYGTDQNVANGLNSGALIQHTCLVK